MMLEELKNKKILIVGRGIEGNAAYKYLKKHLPISIIDIVDQKDGKNYLNKQKNYDIAIKSPGVKPQFLTIPYTTSTNVFMSNVKGKVIGITGTKGKSTTSTLIYKMLKKQGLNVYLSGNIGQSPLDFLDKLNDRTWIALEMSSFQLNDLKISPARNASAPARIDSQSVSGESVAGGPHIAVLLMITSEHLDYHKTYEQYIDAKRNILRFQNPEDFAVINRDYLVSHESDIYTQGKIFQVSRERKVGNGCFVKENSVWISRDGKKEKIIEIDRIKLLGKHNLENVCAAVCAATLAGVSKINIAKVLTEFGGLEHRLELVDEKNGILFYNDSLATVPEACIQALEALPNTETLIAGGHDRGLDYSSLAQYLNKKQIKTLILFPPTGIKIWEEICRVTSDIGRPEKFDVKTMEQAVQIAASKTEPGKICLLSPASASFGIFKDYKDRGKQFKKEVSRLKAI